MPRYIERISVDFAPHNTRLFRADGFDAYFHQFFHAYVTAALFTCTDESDESGGEPLDANFDAADIERETLEQMAVDCFEFLATTMQAPGQLITCYEVIDRAYGLDAFESENSDNNAWKQAGYDFWLTRNGHGAGFWEDEWTSVYDPCTRLNRAAARFGDFDLMVDTLDATIEERKIYGFPLK